MNQKKQTIAFKVKYGEKQITVSCLQNVSKIEFQIVKSSKKFTDYIQKMKLAPPWIQFDNITVQSVYLFSNQRLGFVTIKVQGKDKGQSFQQYVFLRGASVAVLLFANDKLVVVQQYRVPKQELCIEPPAGMLDESGNITIKAFQEVLQETGIRVVPQKLIPLGSYLSNPSISDQQMHLYYAEVKLKTEQIEQISEKVHGQVGSKEKIRVKFIQYDPVTILNTRNFSFIALAAAYENWKKSSNIEKQ